MTMRIFFLGCVLVLCKVHSSITYDVLPRKVEELLRKNHQVPLEQAENCAKLIASLNDSAAWLDTNLAKTSADSAPQNILDHFVVGAITNTCGHLKTKSDVGNGLMKSNNQTIVLDAEERIREIYLLDDSENSKAKRSAFATDVAGIFTALFNSYLDVKCESRSRAKRDSIAVCISVFQGCEVDIERIANMNTIPLPTKIGGAEILIRKSDYGYGVASVAPVIAFVEG